MNATHEHWKPVVGFEGSYEVSDHGRVRSVDRTVTRSNGVVQKRRGQLLSANTIKGDYRQVGLAQVGSARKMKLVHHLVLEAFVGPRPVGQEACHDDGDPSNNHVENLRWDTPSANTHDRVRHGTHHSARKTHCPRGHAYDYFYRRPDGGINRFCRTCRRDSGRRRKNKG